MRKFLFAGLVALLPTSGFCLQSFSESINKSSYTQSNDTLQHIPGTVSGTELQGIVVGSGTIGGLLTLYDSSATATVPISTVTLQAAFNPQFFITVSSGITYTTVGNTNGVTIIYRNPRLP